MSATATVRHKSAVSPPATHVAARPHTIRYQHALTLYWARRIQPESGEGASIGYQAAHYLSTLLAWADHRFLMTSLHAGQPLSLANSTQHGLSGHSPRQCLRLRKALERNGLIRVQPGSFNAGSSYSARVVIEFGNILDPAEPALAAERRAWRKPTRRESDTPWTESPGGASSAWTDSPAIEPMVLPKYPRSGAVEVGEEPPTKNERPSQTPEISPDVPEAAPVIAAPALAAPAPQPSVDSDDMELAAPCIRAWQGSSKCPRRRRGGLEKAVRSEGDAQTVRLIASLARDGVPERVLVKAFTDCLAAYSPDQDPKYRSPYIQSLVWFQVWVENSVDPWRRQQRRQEKLREEQAHRRRETRGDHMDDVVGMAPRGSIDAGRDSETVSTATLSSFHDRYCDARFLPPESVLLEEIAAVDPELASRLRDDGSTKREILEAVKRTPSARV